MATAHDTRTTSRTGQTVPYKTIVATIGMVVATYLLWIIAQRVGRILELIVVAAFFAMALHPAVEYLERRTHMRRGLAATVVFLTGAVAMTALLYVFIQPLVDQAFQLSERFPSMLEDAKQGRGAIGGLIHDYGLDKWVERNQAEIRSAVSSSTGPVVTIASTVAATVAAFLTILVLSFLMLLQGPTMLRGLLPYFDGSTQRRIRKILNDASRAVTGYITGNLLISGIAGTVTFFNLLLTGVPFAGVLAVWVAFADLIPLVGATLGAVPTIGVAFLHSTDAGIIAVVVYVIYQQIENHILQPTIMSRTVKVDALTVLVSVLIGVKLAGLLGALFAIPTVAVLQLILKDALEHRVERHDLDETPVAVLEGEDSSEHESSSASGNSPANG